MPGQRYDVPLGVSDQSASNVPLSVFDPPAIHLTAEAGGGGYAQLEPATTSRLGGIIVGEDLQITENGVLSVTKANAVEMDNTHPITSAAVYVEVGNINALLQTI